MASRIVLIGVFFISAVFILSAQKIECGSPAPTIEQIRLFKKLGHQAELNRDFSSRQSTTDLAIVAHIIRRDDGTGGLSELDLNEALDNVNAYYSNAGLSFFILTINYIDESKYYDFVNSDEGQLTSRYNFENTINVYFANSVGNGEGGFFCGYAYFPGGPDVILMDNSCTMNGSTFPHEIGHFFALFHTHGRSNSELTDELVTRGEGRNCATAGDQLCDTEADPNLSGKVNGACQYTESETDANGDTFVPDANNIMSYSTKACRDVFSQGQYDRMNEAYTTRRNYLKQTNYLADFTFDLGSLCTGQSVSFTNKSINADTYAWEFEGGNPATSSLDNPVVAYDVAGTYSVKLTITSADGGETKIIENAIRVDEELSSSETSAEGSFEESSIEEKVINSDNSITWLKSNSASTDGDGSAYLDFFNYQKVGQQDFLVFAVLNTTVDKSFELSFDYAYSGYSPDFPDGLSVVYRGSCEPTWQSIYSKEGADLQTTSTYFTSQFVPSAEDWKQETISFEVPNDKKVIEVAFLGINGWGNNLYIDNYTISSAGGGSGIVVSSLEVQDTSCPDTSDGSIEIIAQGNGPFTYSINGGPLASENVFANLPVGEYEIGIEDVVQNSETVNVTVSYLNDYPEKPVIEIQNTELVIELSSNQSAQWYYNGAQIASATQSSFSDLQEGTYSVEVSAGICSTMSDDFELINVSVESVDVTSTSCPDVSDGSISLEISGTPPYDFSIDGSDFQDVGQFLELVAGSYEITIRNLLDDPISETVEVLSENEYPQVPVIVKTENSLSVSIADGQTLQWYLNDELLVGETSATLLNLVTGIYSVEVSNGSCATLSEPFELTVLGFEQLVQVHLFPNPVQDKLSIELGNTPLRPDYVTVTDLAGKFISRKGYSQTIDVKDLEDGIYLLKL
ncbi:MAG: T9SS type A sorting domain-containing protein, partial [Ekhidna sp.]|nr:T9SS type A sorting domain-containing protein [Ekhidna sp.]